MDNIEQYKTILEIIVIIVGLAQPYPLLAIAAGLGTIYYLVQDKDEKKDKKDDNTEQ